MAIESTSMSSLLAKLDAARAALAQGPAAASSTSGASSTSSVAGQAAAGGVDFAALLRKSLAVVDQTQAQAMTLADRFQTGDSKVTLEETMIALAKANVSFQQLVQVRNRMISAYHDVMNMQI
jgi:flagellar hook-basal body complex protein FliE